jgi:hypothetical protein
MSQYMLLLYNNPEGMRNLGPEEMQQALEKYMAWTQKPFMVRAARLGMDDLGKVIRAANGQPRITDGPYSETKEVLGGYYLIEAANYDEAVQRSLDHPHLQYGGTIEVRHLYGS